MPFAPGGMEREVVAAPKAVDIDMEAELEAVFTLNVGKAVEDEFVKK
jgi:hypothetical protein